MFSRAASLVLALAAFSPLVSAAQSCTRSYTVKPGDTCDGISASQSVSTYQLATNNPSVNTACTNLQIGQVLCLGTEGEDCDDTVVVESGDTCDDLVSCAGINITMFYHNNPTVDKDCSNLYVGQVVCVASQGLVPAMGESAPSSAPASAAPVNVAPSPSVHPTPSSSPAPTAAPASSVQTTAAPSSSASSGDDGDDGDVPFCDELEDDDDEDDEESWN